MTLHAAHTTPAETAYETTKVDTTSRKEIDVTVTKRRNKKGCDTEKKKIACAWVSVARRCQNKREGRIK